MNMYLEFSSGPTHTQTQNSRPRPTSRCWRSRRLEPQPVNARPLMGRPKGVEGQLTDSANSSKPAIRVAFDSSGPA